MIDINFLRANPDAVRENIRKKFQDKKLPLVDEVIELDAKRRELQKEGDALRATRNTLSAQIGKLMKEKRRRRQTPSRRKSSQTTNASPKSKR